MIRENKYGYKVCYIEKGCKKMMRYIVTNSLMLAEMELRYFETNPQYERKTNRKLNNPTWYIVPVKTYMEYKRLWRDCPF